jgi:hypothetical protein
MNQYQEHLQDSQPDNSRWDGFCRGDTDSEADCGSKVIGRLTSDGGYKVEIIESWYRYDTDFDVFVDGNRVHSTDDRAKAIVVARWWMDGCPA